MRSYIRHPSDIPIEYQADDNNAGVSQERLNNVSAGGISFSCSREIARGTHITIRMDKVKPGFEARGQVAWCQPDREEGFVVGVAFTEADDLFRVRMVEQLCHIEHYKTEVLAREGRHLNGEQAAREWIRQFAHRFPVLDE